ncbi:hypothetical protein EIP91_000381 [Steccherinum ochraceum]|uniref:Uncharacterized protein n=1 Tax=Steccherinum ochraceum TaxID=92696 RepID=A0A4R0RMF6_9APHY|nr:hypothetical protein EIP91_000381 [Steccherinum ochraceum]
MSSTTSSAQVSATPSQVPLDSMGLPALSGGASLYLYILLAALSLLIGLVFLFFGRSWIRNRQHRIVAGWVIYDSNSPVFSASHVEKPKIYDVCINMAAEINERAETWGAGDWEKTQNSFAAPPIDYADTSQDPMAISLVTN